jgi:hypothetical protein
VTQFVSTRDFDAQFLRMSFQNTIEKHPDTATGEKAQERAKERSLEHAVD